ncbi:MAG: primosomal protein N' [Chloroflexi bacterium]|nr:primosomal protein N' [Chloroflexota bacterium]|tara:strand:- start:40084 stop:42549 length:2466 start_codon:yes stop_codon:yes gene_type:complete
MGFDALDDQYIQQDHKKYARVIVDARLFSREDIFTYLIPEHLNVSIGHLVRVPFGRKTIRGLVFDIIDSPDVHYTKPIDSIIVETPVLNLKKIKLAEWVAGYYRASLFDAISPMLPPGFRYKSQDLIEINNSTFTRESDLSTGEKALMEYLRLHPNSKHSIQALVNSRGTWARNTIMSLLGKKLIKYVTEDFVYKSRALRNNFLELIVKGESLRAYYKIHPNAKKQLALLKSLTLRKFMSLQEARKEYGATAVSSIVDAGLVKLINVELANVSKVLEPSKLPTKDQKIAIDRIKNSLNKESNNDGSTWLLHGITGSGKTEVYLQVIAHCLDSGSNAIVLVPELALTPQMLSRFQVRFASNVGVLHSGMPINQQKEEWWRIFNGERKIVLGTRSAIFAPLEDVGLIILDEEHEWTYKQHELSPKYHTRDVAMYLARSQGATVLLGSATPDIGTAFLAQKGVIKKLKLPNRIERSGAERGLASVETVDMRDELKAGNKSILSRLLQEKLISNFNAKKQAILFLNQRGSARAVKCRDCGFVVNCSRCSIGMTYYHDNGHQRLRCHHCGKVGFTPTKCPQCKGYRIKSVGVGTEGLESEIKRVLPSARIMRWDSDSASSIKAHEGILRRFSNQDADILIGTQMIAKGLDIPSVDLVGVVLADIGLHFPDFRASERTFQVLAQVAGRAGRDTNRGDVIIQSYLPDHYAIQAAAAQNYESFYDSEIKFRRDLQYPPYTRMIRLQLDQSNYELGQKESRRFRNLLDKIVREWDMDRVQVIGPAPSYPHKVRNVWRWHLIIRSTDPEYLLSKVAIPSVWSVDVDPMNFS